jgi:hypothetical protein
MPSFILATGSILRVVGVWVNRIGKIRSSSRALSASAEEPVPEGLLGQELERDEAQYHVRLVARMSERWPRRSESRPIRVLRQDNRRLIVHRLPLERTRYERTSQSHHHRVQTLRMAGAKPEVRRWEDSDSPVAHAREGHGVITPPRPGLPPDSPAQWSYRVQSTLNASSAIFRSVSSPSNGGTS